MRVQSLMSRRRGTPVHPLVGAQSKFVEEVPFEGEEEAGGQEIKADILKLMFNVFTIRNMAI